MKLIRVALFVLALCAAGRLSVSAQTIDWKGHTWEVNNGAPIGDGSAGGQISGSAGNIVVDSNGYLHLKISGSGASATGAEMSSTDNLGFGSIYYVLQGTITSMQPSVVLSGFTYGPAANVGVDGENELDIEFSMWNGADGNINGDFTFYPNTGQGAGGASYTNNWLINLGASTVNTCRIDWSSTSVTASIWTGVVPPTASTSTALKTATYTGTVKTIPQSACPMMFNLWTFGAYPTQPLDMVVQDFQYIPLGTGPSTYAITASSGTGGSISPSGSIKVNAGASQAFTITPASGYVTASVAVDGSNKGAISSYTFSNVAANHTISAAFSKKLYTITASAGAGGSISPSGAVAVSSGGNQTFTITPSTGYNIASVLVDGVSQGSNSSYTFSNVTFNRTISASFSKAIADANIAPSGVGYLWSKNTTEASNANQVASTVVNDNNITNTVVVNPNGEGGAAIWEGAGVVWSAAKTISSAKFVNGGDDGYGNGYFESNCRLQFSTDGSTWTDSGWTLSPAYPNSSAAYGKTFMFSGTAKTGVRAARVAGQTGADSWSWTVSEVQFIGH